MGKTLTAALRSAIVMALLFALLLGLIYPLVLTGFGQMLFPAQANGSLVVEQGRVIGSTVVGQAFVSERYFRSRPSAAGKGYDGLASSGSNLGPTSAALAERVRADLASYRTSPGSLVPPDLVTASASGLDPDLSPEAAFYQVPRIARVRSLPEPRVRALVEANVRRPLLGEPHVNLLALNRALDRLGPAG
ncbi:potassium-transporting ATPase subunit KdpC [Sphingomonas jatrophae]|uniref:Potassium-transporting ATPase KdpC subunit n=1 Tax=Sphingomonas jatrophae TaxID=1166337 RepID=A0A1I6JZZ2_9SPHN|nr:potassium-transporting ATPase subunit KdpC [Sphingomonas jatrophae]SFR84562.1 K+-transporting ATPase ATPase C chain [Sphingomonas jatrophae]